MSRPNADFLKRRARLLKALVKQGCYLFPIKKHRKVPKGMWPELSTNNWDIIQTWLDRKLNIGIDTGKSNLLVIDLDTKEYSAEELKDTLELFYGEIPNTFTVKTASGGLHFYFKQPNSLGNTSQALLKDIDTRGQGGYVVAPGSVVIDKNIAKDLLVEKTWTTDDGRDITYEDFDYATLYKQDINWLYYEKASEGKILFADLPKHYYDKLTEASESPTKGVACEIDAEDVDTEGAVTGAIDYCTDRHPPAIEGDGGDNTTYQLFTRLRDMGLTEDTAVEIASDYYNPRCEPAWEFEELQKIASHAYTYAKEPLGIMSAHADFKDDDEDLYDTEVLQIVIPETNKIIQPQRNTERASKPIKERTEDRKQEKKQEKVDQTSRKVARLNLAFSDKAGKVRYVYVASDDEVYNRLSGSIIKPSAFNRSKRLEYLQYMEDNKVSAFEAAEDMGHLVHAEAFDYIPGEPIFAPSPKDPESIIWNTYVDVPLQPIEGSTEKFDKYLNFLFDKAADREVVLNFMAHRLQNPKKIQSYALLVFGNHGSGKTLFAQLLGALVGQDNFNTVKAGDLKSQFNGWAMNKQLILLDECMDIGTREIGNALKTIIAAREISINRKNKNQVKVRNFSDYVITSNYDDAVPMDFGERRYYVIETDRSIKSAHEDSGTFDILDPIHAMANLRNDEAIKDLQAVYHMLLNRDISKYNPDILPGRTEAMENMIRANRYPWQSFLEEAIYSKDHGFSFDAYALSDIAILIRQAGFTKDIKLSAISNFLRTDLGLKLYSQCRTNNFRKDIIVIRNDLAWTQVAEYGIKKALAEYVKSHSSAAIEFIDPDDVVSAEDFLKDFTIRNNVSPIKK